MHQSLLISVGKIWTDNWDPGSGRHPLFGCYPIYLHLRMRRSWELKAKMQDLEAWILYFINLFHCLSFCLFISLSSCPSVLLPIHLSPLPQNGSRLIGSYLGTLFTGCFVAPYPCWYSFSSYGPHAFLLSVCLYNLSIYLMTLQDLLKVFMTRLDLRNFELLRFSCDSLRLNKVYVRNMICICHRFSTPIWGKNF